MEAKSNESAGQSAPRSGAPAPAPSLDTKCQNPTNPGKVPWDRKQKRAYHKALTLLKYWESCGYQAFFVTLTGSPGSDAKLLSYHHERLKLSVLRKLEFAALEHFKVITVEGHGVIHALWAIPPAQKGFRDAAAFIPQAWLSEEWQRIHGARIVDIRRVRVGHASRRNLSRYIVSQYCGGQSGFVRSDYTRPKWLGFAIRATWERLKRRWRELKYTGLTFGELCLAWERLVYVRSCVLGDRQFAVWDGELQEV